MPAVRAVWASDTHGASSSRGAARLSHLLLCALVVVAAPVPARAQAEPPSSIGAGAPAGREDSGGQAPRLSMAVDVSITVGPDDPYWFNYTDYYQNALQYFVASLGGAFRLTRWMEAVGEVRLENDDRVRLSAAYARLRPWSGHPVTVSAGRVPPVFGAFALTRYGSDNPLVSRPLAYQYLSTLRYDVVPVSADSLLAVRGSGWRVRYPESRPPSPNVPAPPAAGVPMVSTSRWDTGVIAHVEGRGFEVSGGLTVGSLADPRVDDNNGGKQLVARAEWHPTAAWSIGASAARGAFVSDAGAETAGASGRSWPQRAVGVDATYARGHSRVRGEALFGAWTIPEVSAPYVDGPLGARSVTLEVMQRVLPRLDVAARADWLGFSDIVGTRYGGQPTTWDADVSRVEAGVSYRLARRWRVKAVYQHNWRYGAKRESEGFPAAQLVVWF